MILKFEDFINEQRLNESKEFHSLDITEKGKPFKKDSKSLKMWITYFKNTLEDGYKKDKSIIIEPSNIKDLIKNVNKAYKVNGSKRLVKFLNTTDSKEVFPTKAEDSDSEGLARMSEKYGFEIYDGLDESTHFDFDIFTHYKEQMLKDKNFTNVKDIEEDKPILSLEFMYKGNMGKFVVNGSRSVFELNKTNFSVVKNFDDMITKLEEFID